MAPGIDLAQARTTAVITLTFVGFSVLSIVATPFTGWRRLLFVSLAGAFVATMVFPATRQFFALHPPPLIVWLAAVGIASIVWSFARLFVPGEEPVGPEDGPRLSRYPCPLRGRPQWISPLASEAR